MTIHCIVGGQFGSEAKGHVAAQLTRRLYAFDQSTALVRVGGSNAGHSAADDNGTIWALRQIPAAAVVDKSAWLVIAQGSEVDAEVLFDEIDRLDEAGFEVSSRLYIDKYATLVEPHHIERERSSDLTARLGSTSKGIGAARADRVMRTATIMRDADQFNKTCENKYGHTFIEDTARLIGTWHRTGRHVIVEGTQGYGLGMHTRFYPQTTSGDCRTVDLLAQIGYLPLNPSQARDIHTWLVLRTYPIRVAGNSGEIGTELTWEQLTETSGGYIQPERTTVTKKIRRVAEWDSALVVDAVQANGGAGSHLHPCLMFIDYLDPAVAGLSSELKFRDVKFTPLRQQLKKFASDIGAPIAMYGTSPTTVICDNTMLESQVAGWHSYDHTPTTQRKAN